MKRILCAVFSAPLFLAAGSGLAASDLGLFLGGYCNPFNPVYGGGTAAISFSVGEFDDTCMVIEGRYAFGGMKVTFEGENRYSVRGGTVDHWVQGGVMEAGASGLYQFPVHENLSIRFGLAFAFLWGEVLEGTPYKSAGNGSVAGINGVAGLVVFPGRVYSFIVSVAPGIMINPYRPPDRLFGFGMPIAVSVGLSDLFGSVFGR
jgi:hypothetical protein